MAPPGVGAFLPGVFPGRREVHRQIEMYAAAWAAANEAALDGDGPVWVALGDSTAQGIGASSWDAGYVGQFLRLLRDETGESWRVVNLSRSGARVVDVARDQLDHMARLVPHPDLVSCVIGANDVFTSRLADVRRHFGDVAERLPRSSILATVPKGLPRWRAQTINEIIRHVTATHGHRLADIWAHSGPPWRGKLCADRFHPNDVGYEMGTAALAEVLGLPFTRSDAGDESEVA